MISTTLYCLYISTFDCYCRKIIGDVFELIHYCVQVVRLLCLYFQIDILCNEEILGKDHMLKFIIATRWRVCVSIVVL